MGSGIRNGFPRLVSPAHSDSEHTCAHGRPHVRGRISEVRDAVERRADAFRQHDEPGRVRLARSRAVADGAVHESVEEARDHGVHSRLVLVGQDSDLLSAGAQVAHGFDDAVVRAGVLVAMRIVIRGPAGIELIDILPGRIRGKRPLDERTGAVAYHEADILLRALGEAERLQHGVRRGGQVVERVQDGAVHIEYECIVACGHCGLLS